MTVNPAAASANQTFTLPADHPYHQFFKKTAVHVPFTPQIIQQPKQEDISARLDRIEKEFADFKYRMEEKIVENLTQIFSRKNNMFESTLKSFVASGYLQSVEEEDEEEDEEEEVNSEFDPESIIVFPIPGLIVTPASSSKGKTEA